MSYYTKPKTFYTDSQILNICLDWGFSFMLVSVCILSALSFSGASLVGFTMYFTHTLEYVYLSLAPSILCWLVITACCIVFWHRCFAYARFYHVALGLFQYVLYSLVAVCVLDYLSKTGGL